jgi:peptide methionine sulfoxide reductase MsrA
MSLDVHLQTVYSVLQYATHHKYIVMNKPIARQRPQHTHGQQYRSGVFYAVVRP